MASSCQKLWKCPLDFFRMTIARVAKNWKNQNNLPCLDRPSQSPDLNLIENVWRMIKIRLSRMQHKNKSKQELALKDNVMTIWASFTPGYIQCLYNTIPDRLQAVIKAKGHATKYWKIQMSTTNSFNVSLIFTTLFYCSQYRWRRKNVTHLWHGTVYLKWTMFPQYYPGDFQFSQSNEFWLILE